MPQLDRKYPSGAAKRGGEPTEESAASSTQVVSSSYVCLVHNQMYHTQKLNFCKNEVDKYML